MRFKILSSKKDTLVRQTFCSCAQKWNGFTRCSSICNIFQQISSFISMCQHSSCTVFTQGRAKPSKRIVCKFCLVPLQLLLGMGREFSAVAVLQVLSSQFKHCKSYRSEHAYKTVCKVPRAELPAALLGKQGRKDKQCRTSKPVSEGGMDRGWGCSFFFKWTNTIYSTYIIWCN